MADETVEVVRSVSSGLVCRARSTTRDATPLVLDSSGRPQPDAFTNTEAFLAGVSSCGVTLIETHARETGVPLARMTTTIEGVRRPSEPRFSAITLRFELVGVTQAQADALVETYRRR